MGGKIFQLSAVGLGRKGDALHAFFGKQLGGQGIEHRQARPGFHLGLGRFCQAPAAPTVDFHGHAFVGTLG